MQLQPWYHSCSAGFTLRGEHSVPSGKPVLHFVHGNGYCTRTYEPMLELLAPHFDLFLSDVQGHGNSDHGGRFHGWNRTADLCLEAWRSTAAQFGLYARNTLAQRARKRRSQWPDRETAFRALHERGMFKGWREEALWAYVNHALKDVEGGVELKCKPTREAEVFGSYPRRLWVSLERVHTPTLVLRGDRSYPFAAKAISRWAAQNPSIQEQEVPGGHCFMQEDPETSATLIRDFLLQELRAAA
jgi:pimeloyl-ACP methyl ester carboxylesterase